MKSFIQSGNVVTVPAPYDVSSGGGVLVGSLFGVAQVSATAGSDVALVVVGVCALAKVSNQAWAVGVKVYWDDAAKLCTSVAIDNTPIGCAVYAAANPSATGMVRLSGGA